MSDFSGMEDLLQDFLQEANDLLSDVDNKLVDLERAPDDRRLLNDIFRGFHTVKGGAGFLNATELVRLCHLTENLFDKLRKAADFDTYKSLLGQIQTQFANDCPFICLYYRTGAIMTRKLFTSARDVREPNIFRGIEAFGN